MIVDCHSHIWGDGFLPPAFFRKAAERWAAKDPARRPDMIMPRLLSGLVDETGDLFVSNMDTSGVDVSLIMMVDGGEPLFGEEPQVPVEAQIEWYADLQSRHRGRLYVNVFPDQRRPNCLELIRRAVRDLGFVGLGEITPDGFRVSDRELRPVMHLAAELGVPVQVHTRSGIWTDYYGQDLSEDNPTHPIHVARLAREVPELKLVLAHTGFPYWWQAAAELVADLPNCYLDISDWNEFVDQPEEVIPRMAAWRGIVGAERILFGSDQASGERFCGERSTLDRWTRMIRDLPTVARECGYRFTDAETAQILGENARRFYALP